MCVCVCVQVSVHHHMALPGYRFVLQEKVMCTFGNRLYIGQVTHCNTRINACDRRVILLSYSTVFYCMALAIDITI